MTIMSFEQLVRSKANAEGKLVGGFDIKGIFIERWHEEDRVAIVKAYIPKEDLPSELDEVFLLVKDDPEDPNKLWASRIDIADFSSSEPE